MAVSVVSPLLNRLTFVNWDKKKDNPFHIDKNRIFYRRVPVGRVLLDERRLDRVQQDDVPYRRASLR